MGRTGRLPLNSMYAIFSALPSALVILKPGDRDFTVQEVNESFLHLTGMNRQALINKPFFKTLESFVANGCAQALEELRVALQNVISGKELIETDILEFHLPTDDSLKKNIVSERRNRFSGLCKCCR